MIPNSWVTNLLFPPPLFPLLFVFIFCNHDDCWSFTRSAATLAASSSKPVAVSEMLIVNDDDDDSGKDERDEKDNALRTFPESLKFALMHAHQAHEEEKRRRRGYEHE